MIVICEKCSDTRCNSGVSGKGCGSLGEAGIRNHPCKACNNEKYKPAK